MKLLTEIQLKIVSCHLRVNPSVEPIPKTERISRKHKSASRRLRTTREPEEISQWHFLNQEQSAAMSESTETVKPQCHCA
jgi:hypothetical protein